MVTRSFKKCGISNSTDGTEDDMWEEEEGTVPDEESEDQESEDEDAYDDCLTEEEGQNLFGTSNDEEDFDGF